MLKYPCLVLDHDDTVVQSEKTIGYPFFCKILEQYRPGKHISLKDYVLDCHNLGFADMCRHRFQFSEQELLDEYLAWKDHIRTNIPAPFPGIGNIIRRQKEAGGLICVVSHSSAENITRDYDTHFAIQPDAIYGWDRPPHQRKPNPWPLEDIMARFGLKPEEILVVDDMKLACMMAEPLGIKVGYAGWDEMGVPALREEMEKLCAYSFHSTEELEKILFD